MFSTVKSVEVDRDEQLRSYLTSIYNNMILGLITSALASALSISSGLVNVLAHHGVLFWATIIVPFALIFVMANLKDRDNSTQSLRAIFLLFAAIEGLSLSVVLMKYSGTNIAMAFLATAAAFAGASLWGYTTKRNLTGMGSFFLMAMIGLIVALIIGILLHSTVLSIIISMVAVVLFAGLVAYDTQTMKADFILGDTDGNARKAVWYALDLYLDFLNLFLHILRLLGYASGDD